VRIGVISDTHGHFDTRLPELFAGVDHILHAGDIGLPWVILELEQIAPVTAVRGNNDDGLAFGETAVTDLGGRRFLVHHIVDPSEPARPIARRIIRENPDVVIFGHTHRRYCETIAQTLYFNPGYAGKPRFGLPRGVAILHGDAAGITAEFLELP
jgi:hypothetical protein